MVSEAIRSMAWAAAKPVALEEWANGSSDTTQMLTCVSRALDAALEALFGGRVECVTDRALRIGQDNAGAQRVMDDQQKPTVPEVLPLVWHYRDHYEHGGAGGSLHIVLDDGNVEDSHVEFCRQFAIEHGDSEGEKLAEILLRMSKTQRSKLAARFYDDGQDEGGSH